MKGPRMQSQGNRFNIMSRKAQKKRHHCRRSLKKSERKYILKNTRLPQRIDLSKSFQQERLAPYPIYPDSYYDPDIAKHPSCTLTVIEKHKESLQKQHVNKIRNTILNSGNLSKIKRILRRIDPNVITGEYTGIPMFHILVSQFEYEKVKLFIEYGMYVDYQDIRGRTALVNLIGALSSYRTDILGVQSSTRYMVELLVSEGANLNIPDRNGNTCLHHCVSQNLDPYIFNLLVHFGANKLYRNNKGELPGMRPSTIRSNPYVHETTRIMSLQECAHNSIKFRDINVSKLPSTLTDIPIPNLPTDELQYCRYVIRRY